MAPGIEMKAIALAGTDRPVKGIGIQNLADRRFVVKAALFQRVLQQLYFHRVQLCHRVRARP